MHDTIDGEAVVRVELFGKGAAGRSMILDAKDWRSISRRWGVHWICYASSKGSVYVGSGRRAPASQAKQSGPAPTALLSRIITKAPPKAVVTYRNGDRLDLRRGNLEVTTRREVTRRRLEGLAEQTIH
ncbi:MAG: HNH endonuclease [Rhodospirillales bacterium]|nr:HNH endonuclease [Rhodospirillales bacterium]